MNNGYQIDYKELGKRINRLRHDDDGKVIITQEELANRAGLGGKAQISKYEKGLVPKITVETLCRFAYALDCEPDFLLGRIPHPKRTTSEVSEFVPLSRKAIESLEYLKHENDDYGNFDTMLISSILGDLIVSIVESYIQHPLFDERGKVPEVDDFVSNITDLLLAYESIADNESCNNIPLEMDKSYRKEKLTIRGVSSWLGSNIAEVIRKSVKTFADPKRVLSEEV